jgi:LuxR family maltose regulon positive regulatory protein
MIDAAKLEVPWRRPGLVARTRLLARVDSATHARVILVLGPPGSGKTTLLAQLADRHPSDVAWLSVDDGDNDPVRLLQLATAAIERLAPLDEPVLASLSSPDANALRHLPRLTNALRRQGRAVTLVVDNAHSVTDPAAADVLALLVDRLPMGSRVVLGGRNAPELPLARWLAAGVLLELGGDDLALDTLETAAVVKAAGLELVGHEIEAVVEATEGWAVAVYLTTLGIRDGRPAGDPPRIGGDDDLLREYLDQQVIKQLQPDDLRFMTRTSILDALNGPLCDAVSGMRGSEDRLSSLARRNLLVVPLEGGRHWYRYHSLLREVLRRRLERAGPGTAPRLHAVAASWMEREGSVQTAIDHALAGGDVTTAKRLIAEHGLTIYRNSGSDKLGRWFRTLGDDVVAEDAVLAMLHAWLGVMLGIPAEAERWADLVDDRLAAGGDLGEKGEALLPLLRAAMCRHGLERMLEDADQAVGSLAEASPWRPVGLVIAAYARLLCGDPEGALAVFREVEGLDSARGTGALHMAWAERAMHAIDRRNWNEAQELVLLHRESARSAGVEEYLTSLLGLVAEVRVAIHRGNVRRAQELLVRAQAVRPRLTRALPHWAVRCLTELARAQLLVADSDGAAASLAQAEEVLASRPDLGVLAGRAASLRAQIVSDERAATSAGSLTPAELRILPFLATYLSFKEIAFRLRVSHNTVKTETMGLYAKLNVSTRADAVERAVALGLLEPVYIPDPVSATVSDRSLEPVAAEVR